MLAACDAALLIGDPALQVDRTRYFTLDLAEEWVARTGNRSSSRSGPFASRRLPTRCGGDRGGLKKSRDHGLSPKKLETIAQEWAPRLGLPVEVIRVYLTHNIHYYLDSPVPGGLALYYRLGAEIGALPRVPELRFV